MDEKQLKKIKHNWFYVGYFSGVIVMGILLFLALKFAHVKCATIK